MCCDSVGALGSETADSDHEDKQKGVLRTESILYMPTNQVKR